MSEPNIIVHGDDETNEIVYIVKDGVVVNSILVPQGWVAEDEDSYTPPSDAVVVQDAEVPASIGWLYGDGQLIPPGDGLPTDDAPAASEAEAAPTEDSPAGS